MMLEITAAITALEKIIAAMVNFSLLLCHNAANQPRGFLRRLN